MPGVINTSKNIRSSLNSPTLAANGQPLYAIDSTNPPIHKDEAPRMPLDPPPHLDPAPDEPNEDEDDRATTGNPDGLSSEDQDLVLRGSLRAQALDAMDKLRDAYISLGQVLQKLNAV